MSHPEPPIAQDWSNSSYHWLYWDLKWKLWGASRNLTFACEFSTGDIYRYQDAPKNPWIKVYDASKARMGLDKNKLIQGLLFP